MSGVFISYVHQDSDAVDELKKALELNGIVVWLDREELLPGVRWKNAIAEAIRNGTYFLSIHSKARADRDRSYANEELAVAIEEIRLRPTTKPWLIPVRLDETEIEHRPIGGGETLLDLQICDLRDWNEGVIKLLRGLGVEMPKLSKEQRRKKVFGSPHGSPLAALDLLDEILRKFGNDWFEREWLNAYPANAHRDLFTLGLLEIPKRGGELVRAASPNKDARFAIAVALMKNDTAIAAVEILERDVGVSGQELGKLVSRRLKRGWSITTQKRNGQSLKKWLLVFYPNLILPSKGQPGFLQSQITKTQTVIKGRPPLIDSSLYSTLSEMKQRGLNAVEIGRELGINPETVRRFRRSNRNLWEKL